MIVIHWHYCWTYICSRLKLGSKFESFENNHDH